MGNKVNIFLSIAGFIALIAVVLLIVLSGNNKVATNSYKKDDPSRPIAVLSSNKVDWGNINLNDTKQTDFELKNDGNSPLVIKKLSTSCGCTGVKVTTPDNKVSKEYTMHQPLTDDIAIAPKASAKLTVIYRPFTMPVEGAVTRQVFIESNDPANPSFEINASAVVKK